MAEREFDPGLDTPKANEPGAGWPVPGSPVYQDAQLRERVNEAQRKVDEQSAQDPEDADVRLNETETVQEAAEADNGGFTDTKATNAAARKADAKNVKAAKDAK